MTGRAYVLITAARNEEAYIENTLEAVIAQSILPFKWVIVSDGSTDRTEEIVNIYKKKYNFIHLLCASRRGQHNFGSKVKAVNAGYEQLQNDKYEYIGILDADVSFDSNYFECISKKFERNKKLGIAGGIIQELINGKYISQNISLNSVAGAIQTFRCQCYEEIGGYIPLKYGGIDTAAEIVARYKGWEVQTFPEYRVLHHRRVTTGKGSVLRSKFRHGITHYILGYHPIFQIIRCLLRVTDRPYFWGSMFILLGYLTASCRGYKRPISNDVVNFIRNEQMGRMKSAIFKKSHHGNPR